MWPAAYARRPFSTSIKSWRVSKTTHCGSSRCFASSSVEISILDIIAELRSRHPLQVLCHPPSLQDDHPLGRGDRLGAVGDDDARQVERADRVVDRAFLRHVEGARRFVEKEDPRL